MKKSRSTKNLGVPASPRESKREDGRPVLVPKLRFPEFREDWVREPFDDLYSFKRNNALSRDKLNYKVGSVKNIHYGDIHTKFGSLFDTAKEHVPYINDTESIPADQSDDYCVDGDLIFADASEDTNDVGKCIEIVKLHGDRLVSGLHTILARRNDNRLIVGFGGHLFRSGYLRTQIQREAQGTKVFAISATRLRNVRVAYPSSPAEQHKIASCLSSLDELIGAQGRKVDALRTHKKGLMQQLFPREGETQPRLRFPEFQNAGEWEKSTIGNICKLKAGEFVPASEIRDEFQDGLYPCYGGNGIRGYVQSITHDGLYVVVGRQGALCGNVNLLSGKFHATEHALVVTPSEGFAPEWLYYAFDNLKLNRFSIGQAQPGLSVGVLNNVPIAAPRDGDEQQRIASCLSSLDDRITAETQKLDALKTHKRGLMQQLFPSPEDS